MGTLLRSISRFVGCPNFVLSISKEDVIRGHDVYNFYVNPLRVELSYCGQGNPSSSSGGQWWTAAFITWSFIILKSFAGFFFLCFAESERVNASLGRVCRVFGDYGD